MEIRHILVPVFGRKSDKITLSTALTVAKHLKAHAEVYFICEQTSDTLPYPGIGKYVTPDIHESVMRQVDTEARQRATGARDTFERLCAEYEIQEVKEPRGPGSPSARLQSIVGRLEDIVPRLVRLSDIGLFSGPFQHHHLTPNWLEKALLGSGRPLLFTSLQRVAQRLRHVAVMWDGSAPAARAVLAAQPFLKQAERIDVFCIPDEMSDATLAERFVEYLAWHGLTSSYHALDRTEAETGRILLNAAYESSADLCVMGAYAHSWYEEIVLGGTTQFVLENTEIPLFIMH